MKAETGGGWVCTALWGRQVSHTILSSKRNLRAVTCLFWCGQSCSPPSHPLSSWPLSSQSIMEKPNHHELRAWHRQELQSSWSLMEHSRHNGGTLQSSCTTPAAQTEQNENSQPGVSHQDSELQESRKLGWVSVVLFIFYFAQSTDTGCAITGFQTRLWAAPCCGLQPHTECCPLHLGAAVLPLPHPHLLIWHCRIALPSLKLLWSPQDYQVFFSSYLQTTQHFLYDVQKMGEKSLKSKLQEDTQRCYWGSAAHGDKTVLIAHVYPTQRHSSNKESHDKKPKHSPRWCWASPRWSQRGTLLMSPGTGHLEAQRCKMSVLPDALWQRHSSIKTLLVPMPHISFIISSNHPLPPLCLLPPEKPGQCWVILFSSHFSSPG